MSSDPTILSTALKPIAPLSPFPFATLLRAVHLVGQVGEVNGPSVSELVNLAEAMERGDPALYWLTQHYETLYQQSPRFPPPPPDPQPTPVAPQAVTPRPVVENWAPTDDIHFLGPTVSDDLHERNSNEELLREQGLPVLASPKELADALGVSIKHLRWLAFHNRRATRVHYVSFEAPKRNGGVRILQSPLHMMGRVQRWILANILNKLPIEEPSHGFRPGRSVVSNARAHCGQAFVVGMDLTSFFPSVGWRRVRRVFHRLGYSPCISTILALLCTECPRREEMENGQRLYVAMGPRSLPQGACTSPALSNLVTRRLDRRLFALADRLGMNYTRYADDLSFSGPRDTLGKVTYLMRRVRLIVKEEGFVTNEMKTRVLRRKGRQVVTGLVVNDTPGVNRKEVKRLRAIMHRAKFTGLDAQNVEGVRDMRAWLQGKIAYINMARPETGARLQRQFDDLQSVLVVTGGSPVLEETGEPPVTTD